MIAPRGPIALTPNRVARFYRGGALLDRFRAGGEGPIGADTDAPEDWIGSVTRAWTPPGAPEATEGLSMVSLGGHRARLADILAMRPDQVAGTSLVRAAGATTGVLVKLLDAAVRLPVHVHPTRAFARRHLGSRFGKTEAWVILGTRRIEGEPEPRVWLGFRDAVGREALRRRIERDGGRGLTDLLHSRAVAPGDVWLVPAGTPHAIGAGVFLAEIQEPTDYSIVLETAGFPIHPVDAHLRLGWDRALDALDVEPMSTERLEALHGSVPSSDDPNRARALLPAPAAPFFRAERHRVHGRHRPGLEPAFLVGIVTGGSGAVRAAARELRVRTGSTFAVAAADVPDLELDAPDAMDVIACQPPRAEDIAMEEP